MSFFLKIKSFLVYFTAATFLLASWGCGYKPSYLRESKKAEISNRWRVEKIDPSRLSADEASIYERMGSPQYIRFYRTIAPERERVFEWAYTEPVHLVFFIDGKRVEYVPVDDDTSPLNDNQRKWLFWGGVSAAGVGALALLYYYLFAKK